MSAFTLVYAGPLPPKGTAADKLLLRRKLHPQMRELFNHPPFDQLANYLQPAPSGGAGRITLLSTVGNRTYASLITEELKLYAELDVLLLRRQASGVLSHGGDIDNRLKTLFDGLSIPSQTQAVPSGWQPTQDEQPLICLLQDDRLVTRVNVETDRLLRPESDLPTSDSAQDVQVTIRVTVKASSPIYANMSIT
jgi:hypothetical protein